MSKACSYCEGTNHSAFTCPHKPRTTLKTYKPMSKVGRVAKETAKAVREWKKTQKPNHQGRWTCYICGKEVDYLMAEHVKSKARNPHLRTELTNLKPCCSKCNSEKGSQDGSEYVNTARK